MQVTKDAAQEFLQASDEDRRKLELLFSLYLMHGARAYKPLEVVMREISSSAQVRGLTLEIFEDILKD